MTIAIFGGSFNPPHVGHVLAVTLVLSTTDVESVLVIPTFRHPFAKALAPFDDRVEMCRLAMGWIPRVTISRVEEELGGDSLTVRTLEHLHAKNPDAKYRLIVGADILNEAAKWVRFDDVQKLAPLLVIGRAGVKTEGGLAKGAPAPLLPEISSTQIRDRIRHGDIDGLELLVPRNVLAHIRSRRLYGDQ